MLKSVFHHPPGSIPFFPILLLLTLLYLTGNHILPLFPPCSPYFSALYMDIFNSGDHNRALPL